MMTCPKCNAPRPEGQEECGACGLIFARWRPLPERTIPPASPPLDEEPAGVPAGLVIAVLVFVVVFGAIWTARRREARANRDLAAEGDALLNRINNEGNAERKRLDQELQDARQRFEAAQVAAAPPKNTHWPAGLTDRGAADLLQQCSALAASQIVKVPKMFAEGDYAGTVARFPALAPALQGRLFELDPPIDVRRASVSAYRTVRVVPTIEGLGQMKFSESEGVYEVALGRQRVASVKVTHATMAEAKLTFERVFEELAAARLTDPLPDGEASLIRKDGAWKVVAAQAWNGNTVERLCP